MITRKKIRQCHQLLHKDYQDVKVILYRSRLLFIIKKILKGETFNEITDYLFGRAKAWYNIENQTVNIPLFAFKKGDWISVEVIHALYHELRHYYQFTHKPKIIKERDWNLTVRDSDYKADPTERDANRFAARMCNKYKQEISEILGVKPNWSVKGYP